jgi:hypothetical protein
MTNIKVTNLSETSISRVGSFYNSESFIQDLSESELNLQGGGLFRRRRSTPPVVDVAPLAPVPDILIGFSVGFSI